MCQSNTPLVKTGKSSIRKREFSHVTPVMNLIIEVLPTGTYDEIGDIYFPLSFRSSQYHPKERVIGVEVNGRLKAYPFVELSQAKFTIEYLVAGQKLFLEFKIKTRNGIIPYDRVRVQTSINAFWFVWYTFHPKT